MAITFTSADLDALKEAYLTGAKKVKIGDREIEYRDQSEILEAIRNVTAALEGGSAKTAASSIVQAKYSKGET